METGMRINDSQTEIKGRKPVSLVVLGFMVGACH